MSVIIFATSAAGKSHFSQRSYGPRGIRVVDGDDIIASFKAWPKAKDWWRGPGALEAHSRHAQIIADTLRRNKDIVIVFNTKLDVIVPLLRKVVPDVTMVAVDLPDSRIRQNYALRESQIKAGVSGHSSRPLEHYLEGAKKKREEYAKLKIETFPSFDAVVSKLKLYQRRKVKLY